MRDWARLYGNSVMGGSVLRSGGSEGLSKYLGPGEGEARVAGMSSCHEMTVLLFLSD